MISVFSFPQGRLSAHGSIQLPIQNNSNKNNDKLLQLQGASLDISIYA